MRPSFVALVLLAASALVPVARGEDGEPAFHAEAVAHTEGVFHVTYFWSKGPKLRSETVIAGHRIVTIVNGSTYYAYDLLSREGVAIQRAPEAIARDRKDRRPFGREHEILLAQGAEKVGEEPMGGIPCDVYRVTDADGKRQVWVTQASPPVPLRVEFYRRSTGETRYTDYRSWMGDLPISDDFFQPEEGIAFQRMGLDEFLDRTANEGPVGPVPILYADLLHGGIVGKSR